MAGSLPRGDNSNPNRRMRLHGLARALAAAAAVLIVAYAALIRMDALVEKYGDVDRPAWAAALTTHVGPLGERLRPFAAGWRRVPQPYAGGDPINYLRYAREMQSFYQAHVREPVFLALTRGFLWLLDDQDIAVSFASACGSLLAVIGTWLVAASILSRPSALAATFVLAIEYDVVTWSVDGWRDDTFTATVLWVAWAGLRMQRNPSAGNAVVLGVLAGVSCLTRITALSFVVPALAWLAIEGRWHARSQQWRGSLGASAVAAIVIAPYLVSCAVATGDPLLAINYHTVYYRAGEGQSAAGDVSAAEYIGGKFTRRPIATLDTGLIGVLVQPFVTKWNGLLPPLGDVRWIFMAGAAAGLVLFAALPMLGSRAAAGGAGSGDPALQARSENPDPRHGPLLLIVLFGSLLPYAFTWNIAGGDAWRFTMHAYPFYMIAFFYAADRAVSGVRRIWRTGARPSRPRPRTIKVAAAVALVLLSLACMVAVLPWFVVRETLAHREDVSIEAGWRDWAFFGGGWTAPHDDGVVVRVARADRALVRLPLPRGPAYEIALRLDPLVPAVQHRVAVLFNRQLVARFQLTWDPARVGTYRFHLDADRVRAWSNELAIVSETRVPAASAGPRFGWLDPDARVGVRLWYVRVLPDR